MVCQEWKSGAAEHDRSGKPEGMSWDTLQKVDPHRKGNSYFQSEMDEPKPWRRSRPENIYLDTVATIRGEGHVDFLGESEGSLPPPHDSLPDAGEAMNDFWSMSGNFIFRHHVEPRVKLYSPREESFPIH